jgi:hypothetical protein
MSSTTLTQAQVQQIEAVAAANRGNPTAIWAALSTMGDQYAQGAYLALANPQSIGESAIVLLSSSSILSLVVRTITNADHRNGELYCQ